MVSYLIALLASNVSNVTQTFAFVVLFEVVLLCKNVNTKEEKKKKSILELGGSKWSLIINTC